MHSSLAMLYDSETIKVCNPGLEFKSASSKHHKQTSAILMLKDLEVHTLGRHTSLWLFQSDLLHAGEQYFAFLHLPHTNSLGSPG